MASGSQNMTTYKSSVLSPILNNVSLSNFIDGSDLIYSYHGGGNSIGDKPTNVNAFGVFSFKTASGWYGQLLMSSDTATGLYWRTATSLSGGWRKILDSENYTDWCDSRYVNISGDTMTGQLYINYNKDAVGNQDDGSLVIGDKSGENLVLDANEIMARNNKHTTNLNLNIDNSTDTSHLANVTIGNGSDTNAYMNIRYTTDASSASTGALRVGGGVGIGGKLYVANTTQINNLLTLYRESATSDNLPAGIIFYNRDTTLSRNQNAAHIYAYHSHADNNDGMNLVIKSGGSMIIGAGESPDNLYSTIIGTAAWTAENLYATADTTIYLEAGANTIANRIGISIDASGHILPVKAETANNKAQNIGASNNQFNKIYIADAYASSGAWVGTARFTGTQWSVYAAHNDTTTRYGYIQIHSTDKKMYFRGENGVAEFNFNNAIYTSTGNISTAAGSINAGTDGDTAAERRIKCSSGAGTLYLASQASTTGTRGLYTPAHGTGSSRWAISIDTNNVVSFNGNASTASKWANARTITLTGSVTGSASIDGSGDVSLATTTNHSHTSIVHRSNLAKGSKPSSTIWLLGSWGYETGSGTATKNRFCGLEGSVDTNGRSTMSLRAYKNIADSTASNDFSVWMDQDGTRGYSVTDAAAFRSAIGAGTSSLTIGTSSTTAAAGNHNHDSSYVNVTGDTMVGTGTETTEQWVTLTMGNNKAVDTAGNYSGRIRIYSNLAYYQELRSARSALTASRVVYLPAKDANCTLVDTAGTGASGSWGISVTGSAGSVAWGNVTSKPDNYPGGCTGNAATATSASYLSTPSITTEANIESGTRTYQGSGDSWTGSINSMAYAGILQVCGGYSRGWQIWAKRGNTTESLHWRNPNDGATAWNEERIILDSGNYTSYTVTKAGSGASGTWDISISGNAATATKATQDGSGNTITSYYCTLSTAQTFTGNKTFNSICYFANGTTYYVDQNAVAYFNDLRSDNVRLVDSKIGFYQNANADGNRYGYIQANASRMYFRKENGVSTYGFDFNSHLYTTGHYYASNTNPCLNLACSDLTNVKDAKNGLSANREQGMVCYSKDYGSWMGDFKQGYTQSSGQIWSRMYLRNYKTDGTQVNNYIYLYANKDGTTSYAVSNAAAFRSAISAPSTTGGSASGTWDISVTGNAATATKLGTANKGSSNHPIYLSGGTPTQCAYPQKGAWYSAVPFIHSDGMMEIGRYIDFHGTNDMTGDHTIRFTCATNTARIDCNGVFTATGWSDLAEYRRTIEHEPGRTVIPTDCGIAKRATERLQPGARIVSDTYGFCLGESDDEQSPIALTGRVLAYPCRPISEYHAGDAVCSGPNGTVDLMTREEIQKYPDCIIGIVNEIPTYPIWNPKHTDDRQKVVFNENVEVRGRIWIDIK